MISDLNFHKLSARWVLKMLTKEHRKERLLCLEIFAGTKMKENRSWKALLRDIKHGFRVHPRVKKKLCDLETTKKLKIEQSAKKKW
jgi:hypothetical protein